MAKVPLSNYIQDLEEDIYVFGISDILQELHAEHGEQIREEITDELDPSTYYYWLQGESPVPIKYLQRFVKYDQDLLQKTFEEANAFSAGMKKCNLPRHMDTKLAYLLGAIHGDGHMHKNGKFVTVTVEYLEYIEETINPLFQDLFSVRGGFRDLGTYHRLAVGSRVAHSFLTKFCPPGKKVGKLSIPPILLENQDLLSHYFSGLFDTDGCIGHTQDKKQVYFTFVQKDKDFIFDVYQALKRLGIHVNEPREFSNVQSEEYQTDDNKTLWRIYIGGKESLEQFLKTILFRHPRKKKKAEHVQNII